MLESLKIIHFYCHILTNEGITNVPLIEVVLQTLGEKRMENSMFTPEHARFHYS